MNNTYIAIIVVIIIVCLMIYYKNTDYFILQMKDKGKFVFNNTNVNYDTNCEGSVLKNNISNNVNLKYKCDIDLSPTPVDEEVSILNKIVNNSHKLYEDTIMNINNLKFNSNYENQLDEELYTQQNPRGVVKKVKNAVPGSKQEKINSLNIDIPNTATTDEVNKMGRGVNAEVPETLTVSVN